MLKATRSRLTVVTAATTLSIALLGAPAAQAATNLLSNGSFESDFTDWNLAGGDPLAIEIASSGSLAGFMAAEDGSQFAAMGAFTPSTLSQTFTDVAGQDYQVSFWWWGDGQDTFFLPALLAADIDGGAPQFTLVDPPASTAWTRVTFDFVGTGSDTLTFANTDVLGFIGVDNVSISAIGAPEPATWALMLTGLAGLGAALRSRRRAGARLGVLG